MNAFELLLQFTEIHNVCVNEDREPTDDEDLTLRQCEDDILKMVREALMIDDDDDILCPEAVYGPNYSVIGWEFATYDPNSGDRHLMFKLTM